MRSSVLRKPNEMPDQTPLPLFSAVELKRRSAGGSRVRMLWLPDLDEVLIEQTTLASGEQAVRSVRAGQHPNDAYAHPEVQPLHDGDLRYEVTRGEIDE